jgi:hypothetical protein
MTADGHSARAVLRGETLASPATIFDIGMGSDDPA